MVGELSWYSGYYPAGVIGRWSHCLSVHMMMKSLALNAVTLQIEALELAATTESQQNSFNTEKNVCTKMFSLLMEKCICTVLHNPGPIFGFFVNLENFILIDR